MKQIITLTLFAAILATMAPTARAQQPPPPTPDPGPGSGGAPQKCDCKIHMLSDADMKNIGPVFTVERKKLILEPTGMTIDPPVDEWDGYDDLFRLATHTLKRVDDKTADIGLKVMEAFDVYDGLPGADVAFGPDHVHPYGVIGAEIVFATNGDPKNPVGMRLNGSLLIDAMASVHGSIAMPGAGLFHVSDSVSSAAINVSIAHPLPNCVAEKDKNITETLTMSGSVNTDAAVDGRISVTAGMEGDALNGPNDTPVTKTGASGSATYSLKVSKRVYDGSATSARAILIQGATDLDIVRIPIVINGTINGNGSSDGGEAIGSGTARAGVTWSGRATACAMAAPVSPPASSPVIIIYPGAGVAN
ncbi:MAG: hypothetical protein JNM43_04655 [Planctomycetaceae bacterium]|nr:hypothetical protein [Planctomycetaceae bacterium]